MKLMTGYKVYNGHDINLEGNYQNFKKFSHIILKKNNTQKIKNLSNNKDLDIYFIYVESTKRMFPSLKLLALMDRDNKKLIDISDVSLNGKFKRIPKV